MFVILPVGVDYRAQRYPVITFTLMGICTVVHVISMVDTWNDMGAQLWWYENFWMIPAQSSWDTYITSTFVHGGILHLVGNMIYLFLFGSCVEDIIGRLRFGWFYILGGLVATFTYIALSPSHFQGMIPLGGASGAISACMGGYVLLLHRSKIEFKWIAFFFMRFFSGEFSLPAWLVLSFWFLQDVLSLWLGLRLGHQGGGVAFGAHVGGFVGGMLMIALLKLILRREQALEDGAEAPAPSRPVLAPAAAPAAAPAFADQPMLMVLDAGNQTGPFPLPAVCQMVRDGTVSRQAMYWQEGMSEWQSVQDLA